MKIITLYILSLMLLLSCGQSVVRGESPDTYNPGDGWELAWSDEFNGNALDTSVWNYDLGGGGWGNFELQGYTSNAENISVTNGRLVIRALSTGNIYFPFSSARIHTKHKYSFRYGLVAARIRLPYGLGVWPAFWMMGENIDTVRWPECGEIDIMEIRGGRDLGDSIVYGTVHWYSEEMNRELASGQTEMLTRPGSDEPLRFADGYHVFWALWTSNDIRIGFDDREYFSMEIPRIRKETAAFHKPFFLLLNLAVGGRLTGIASAAEVTAPLPQTMAVDWVRVYRPK